MKRFRRRLLNIIGLLATSFLLFLFIATWVLSYGAVEVISTAGHFVATETVPDPDDPPIKKSLKKETAKFQMRSMGQKMAATFKNLDILDELEDIDQDLRAGKRSDICKVLCKPANFNPGEGLSSARPLDHLKKFYVQQGKGAFEDPAYRMTLEMFISTVTFLSSSMRQFISEFAKDVSKYEVLTTYQKTELATKLQYNLVKEIFVMKENIERGASRHQRIRELIQLRPQCETVDSSRVLKQCQEIQSKIYPSMWSEK